MELSAIVVVPARDEESTIAGCLSALAEQTIGTGSFETINEGANGNPGAANQIAFSVEDSSNHYFIGFANSLSSITGDIPATLDVPLSFTPGPDDIGFKLEVKIFYVKRVYVFDPKLDTLLIGPVSIRVVEDLVEDLKSHVATQVHTCA